MKLEIIILIIGILLVFVCTTLGSAFVYFIKGDVSKKMNQIFMGFAAGVMLSASFFSLLLPASEISISYMPNVLVIALATILGALFMWGIDKLIPHLHPLQNQEEGLSRPNMSKTGKMFLAVTIHNVPEGLSVGIAFGVALATIKINSLSNNSEIFNVLLPALMLSIGIGIQNIPEGAVVSLPMKSETNSKHKAFLFGTLSGAVEPVAALLGLFLALQIEAIMPWALAFAAGCMIYVVAEEMIPDMQGEPTSHHGVWSFIFGFVLMMVLDLMEFF